MIFLVLQQGLNSMVNYEKMSHEESAIFFENLVCIPHITKKSFNHSITIAIKINPKKFISTEVAGIKCMGGTCKCKQYFCNLHNAFFHKP